MNKIIALIKKDYKIQIRNLLPLFFSVGFPLAYLFFINYLFSNDNNNLKLYVDNSVSHMFKMERSITIDYLDEPITVKIEYLQKDSILHLFNKGKIPIAFYNDKINNVFLLNINKSRTTLIYNVMRNYFFPKTPNKYIIKKTFDFNSMMLIIILKLLVII